MPPSLPQGISPLWMSCKPRVTTVFDVACLVFIQVPLVAEDQEFLQSLGIVSHDREEIIEALHRPDDEAFDNRSSWHMRTLIAECAGIVDNLKHAIAEQDEQAIADSLHEIASMAENSKDLNGGLMRAGVDDPILTAGRAYLRSEAIIEAVVLCISSFCRYGEEKSEDVISNIVSFGEAGVAGLLVNVLQHHMANGLLVELTCDAMCCVGVDDKVRSRLGEVGACEVLTRLLIRACTDPASCQPICRAIGCVSFQSENNVNRFYKLEDKILASK